MPAKFVASADDLRHVAEFLSQLTAATEKTGVTITGTVTVQLPDDGDSIDARFDGEQYLIDDRVGG